MIERDVTINAYYIIYYFRQNRKLITNLKLQKLLYFLEAIYLIQNVEEKKLFDDEFYAWNFGPVSNIIYRQFKQFGNREISLTESQQEIAHNMNNENKQYIEKLFTLLGDMTAHQLVSLSHLPNSPWTKLKEKYNGKIPDDIVISKIDTRNWFSQLIGIKIDEK